MPADRAFYEAGLHCRQARKHDMALMFLNRFLDLVEAIENDDGMLDPEGFQVQFNFLCLPIPMPPMLFDARKLGRKEFIMPRTPQFGGGKECFFIKCLAKEIFVWKFRKIDLGPNNYST